MFTSRALAVVVVSTAFAVSACSAAAPQSSGTSSSPSRSATQSPSPVPSVPPPGDGISRAYDIGGFSLGIACRGTSGSPTVIVEAGLDNGGGDWGNVSTLVSSTTRMCHYSRAGLLNSDPDPSKTAPTAASMARELAKLLKVAHLPGPYVLVTHSFGGLVGRLFIEQNPTAVRGVVFEDSCILDQLRSPGGDVGWVDAGRKVDIPTTEKELAKAPGLGSRPIVVLTQDGSDDQWLAWQKTLARLSSDSVHAIASGAGHGIHMDKPDIVVRAIEEVVTAVRTGKPLPSCASTLASVGGQCVSG